MKAGDVSLGRRLLVHVALSSISSEELMSQYTEKLLQLINAAINGMPHLMYYRWELAAGIFPHVSGPSGDCRLLSTRVVHVQYTCCACAAHMLWMCSTHVVDVQYTCCACAVHMLCMCSTHVVHVQYKLINSSHVAWLRLQVAMAHLRVLGRGVGRAFVLEVTPKGWSFVPIKADTSPPIPFLPPVGAYN